MKSESTIQNTNKVVLIINWILDLFLILGYIGEYVKGAKDLGYVISFVALVVIPISLATVIYTRNGKSNWIKFITLIGYFIVYLFVMFTSSNFLVFTYMFPILLMYFLYFDLRLMVVSCSIAVAINVAKIIYSLFALGKSDPLSTTNFTIQFAAVFLYSISVLISTRLSNKFSVQKLKSIEEEKSKQEAILTEVLNTAAILDKNSREVYKIVGELVSSTEIVTSAVSEIAKGSSDTANNIEIQSELTHNIQNIIQDTSEASDKMGEISKETSTAVNDGLTIVNDLGHMSSLVNESSENVYKTMVELKDNSNEIQNITQIITGISEQTNLLSLNAAIESARAGEAGKGFAVVAEQIRKLAVQSSESTSNIVNIISQLHQKSDTSLEAVVKLKDYNQKQNALIDNTQNIFHNITNRMNDVNKNVDMVNQKINQILSANNKLVESINEVSSVSQQTTASSQKASNLTMQNIESANMAKKLVEELIKTSDEMGKHIQ